MEARRVVVIIKRIDQLVFELPTHATFKRTTAAFAKVRNFQTSTCMFTLTRL